MYIFWGKVKKGHQRGKSLGFPTANLNLHKHIPEGIYISQTRIRKQTFPSITFVGAAKTFGQSEVLAEVYILDFDKTIYGEWVSVQLIKKLRENKKFSDIKELINQMKQDEKDARKYFKTTHD